MLVSVIIPCHNVEKYVRECVESALGQTYSDIEIICVENNSTDETWRILSELKELSPKVKIFRQVKEGANAARNFGIENSKGDWLQFLDADDLLEPRKIEHQIGLLNNVGAIAFIAGASKHLKLSGQLIIQDDLDADKFIAVFKNQCGNTCANLWHRESIEKVGNWDENLASSQEADLMNRIVLSGGEYVIDRTPLTIIRERTSGQISQSNAATRWKRYLDVKLRFLDSLEKINKIAYRKYLPYYQDGIVVTLLILARYDLEIATQYFNRYIKDKWNSKHSIGLSFYKVGLIKLFGFKIYGLLNAGIAKVLRKE